MEVFDGLGLTNITVSCHHDPEDTWRYEQTLRMSEDRTVYAMEDMSAFFIKRGRIDVVGTIYKAKDRQLKELTGEDIKELEQDEFRRVFDTIPDQFDKFRPRYSEELFTYLNTEAGIGPGKRVLEIGPGTGQATEPVQTTNQTTRPCTPRYKNCMIVTTSLTSSTPMGNFVTQLRLSTVTQR